MAAVMAARRPAVTVPTRWGGVDAQRPGEGAEIEAGVFADQDQDAQLREGDAVFYLGDGLGGDPG
jgi:hypothetical protein